MWQDLFCKYPYKQAPQPITVSAFISPFFLLLSSTDHFCPVPFSLSSLSLTFILHPLHFSPTPATSLYLCLLSVALCIISDYGMAVCRDLWFFALQWVLYLIRCSFNVASRRVGHQDSGWSLWATPTLFSKTSGEEWDPSCWKGPADVSSLYKILKWSYNRALKCEENPKHLFQRWQSHPLDCLNHS